MDSTDERCIPSREISVDSFHLRRTYAGVMAYCPDAFSEEMQMNFAVGGCETLMKPIWGERQTYVIPPVMENGLAPEWQCYAWLNGPPHVPHFKDPKKNLRALMVGEEYGADGSELVLVWFAHKIPTNPINDALRALEKAGLKFMDLSKDYSL